MHKLLQFIRSNITQPCGPSFNKIFYITILGHIQGCHYALLDKSTIVNNYTNDAINGVTVRIYPDGKLYSMEGYVNNKHTGNSLYVLNDGIMIFVFYRKFNILVETPKSILDYLYKIYSGYQIVS